jgi:hypothetical protein
MTTNRYTTYVPTPLLINSTKKLDTKYLIKHLLVSDIGCLCRWGECDEETLAVELNCNDG